MRHLKKFNESFEDKTIERMMKMPDKIKFLKKVPKEYKEIACQLINSYTTAENGKITGLRLHPDLEARIAEKNLPNGFDMGIDKDGFFIHTHRGRSKSKESVDKITEEEIAFIDSTG